MATPGFGHIERSTHLSQGDGLKKLLSLLLSQNTQHVDSAPIADRHYYD
jgi:hypothetical protein